MTWATGVIQVAELTIPEKYTVYLLRSPRLSPLAAAVTGSYKEVIKEQPPSRNLSAAIGRLLRGTHVANQRPPSKIS
jgi:hypothetical protein